MVLMKKSKKVEEFVNQGCSEKSDNNQSSKTNYITIQLRIPEHALRRLDYLKKKNLHTNRTQWILQAIQKSLEQEEMKEKANGLV